MPRQAGALHGGTIRRTIAISRRTRRSLSSIFPALRCSGESGGKQGGAEREARGKEVERMKENKRLLIL